MFVCIKFFRCELRLLRAMYPDSGYSAETGGIMANLRTSTDNTKVTENSFECNLIDSLQNFK